jgi:hypothetical protein
MTILSDFDPVYDAINAIEDSVTTAEYDNIIGALNTAIASVAARIEKNTDIPIADINNAFGSYSASLKYPPGPTLAFANGARWAASRMVSSVLTLPLVQQPTQKPR